MKLASTRAVDNSQGNYIHRLYYFTYIHTYIRIYFEAKGVITSVLQSPMSHSYDTGNCHEDIEKIKHVCFCFKDHNKAFTWAHVKCNHRVAPLWALWLLPWELREAVPRAITYWGGEYRRVTVHSLAQGPAGSSFFINAPFQVFSGGQPAYTSPLLWIASILSHQGQLRIW